MSMLDRREWLQLAAVAPWLQFGGTLRLEPDGDDVALLVLELEGGNDGLNTLIPTASDAYAKARPQLAQVRRGAHDVGAGWALHPALAAWKPQFERGRFAAVHAVGYPKPDRSHFRSRDIWHTADPDYVRMTAETTGWLGRAADWLHAHGADVPGLGIGAAQMPLVLRGRDVVVPILERIEDYELLLATPQAGRATSRRAVERAATSGADSGAEAQEFLAAVARSAIDGATKLAAGLDRYRPKVEYPQTDLAQRLQLLARIHLSGFGTRLYHMTLGGFDTHARQLPAHDALLRQLGAAVSAFVDDLAAHGVLERFVILIHSEFGRRVAENQSLGTDHGAAGPVFVCGGGVRPGLHGAAPDFARLEQGDLIATTDFRAIYAAVLARMRIDAAAVLGDGHRALTLFSRPR